MIENKKTIPEALDGLIEKLKATKEVLLRVYFSGFSCPENRSKAPKIIIEEARDDEVFTNYTAVMQAGGVLTFKYAPSSVVVYCLPEKHHEAMEAFKKAQIEMIENHVETLKENIEVLKAY